jgi:hypothetical protein
MLLRVGLLLVAVAEGGFMLADGVRNLLTGTYFGGGALGPWSGLVAAAGLDPHHFGVVFAVLGLAWLVAVTGLLTGASWGWWASFAVGVLTLWYMPVGTVLAVVWLGLLVLFTRAGSGAR